MNERWFGNFSQSIGSTGENYIGSRESEPGQTCREVLIKRLKKPDESLGFEGMPQLPTAESVS